MRKALFGTLPGRAIVIGAAVKAAVFAIGLLVGVPRLLQVVDTLASVAIVAGLVYFLTRGLTFVKRRLLWRVRRKLIISYIFIGFVPAILIVAFFLLGGLLLFSNFSAYLTQNRFHTLADRAAAIAQTTAVEIQRTGRREAATVLDHRRAEVESEFPGVSLAVVRATATCRELAVASAAAVPGAAVRSVPPLWSAGSWAHTVAPGALPAWMTCDGFKGLLAASWPNASGSDVALVIRGVRFSEAEGEPYAVVVDIPIGRQLIERLQQETGVTLAEVQTIDAQMGTLEARAAPADPLAAASVNLPMTSVAFLDYADWATGRRSALRAGIRMNVSETYSRIASAEGGAGRYFGQGLLLVLVVIGVLFLIIEALALVVGLALARSITGSVHELFAGTERVRHGDFTHKIDVRAQDQLGELAESFNSMTGSIEDLLREQAEKKRLEEELRIAHEIQMSLLPQGPLGVAGLSVTAVCVPAREVGGDYYDFLMLDEQRVGVLIADVSGKGTSAALYMAELKGLVLSLSRIHQSPRELLIDLNRIIAPHLDSRSFITMTYAIVDLRARTIVYARAGHTPLIHMPASGDRQLRLLAPDGLVVGLKLDNGETFERLLVEETMALGEGDVLLFFTDGISEAMNAADDCFGEQRLGRLVEDHAHLPSDELRERILREIAAFVGDAPQHDDMTMILLRVGTPVAPAAVVAGVAGGVQV